MSVLVNSAAPLPDAVIPERLRVDPAEYLKYGFDRLTLHLGEKHGGLKHAGQQSEMAVARAQERVGMGIQVRRVYDPPEPSDGYRVLIDGIWPRGISKEAAHLDDWARELAVSPSLRRWFKHDPAKWEEFRRRYRAELLAPEHHAALDALAQRVRHGTLTLVYGAHDRQHNNAVVLAEVLGDLTGGATL